MKYTACLAALFVAFSPLMPQAVAQSTETTDGAGVSAKKAFALSFLVPGLGHRYVHGGSWDGWASVFAVADAGLWAGLAGIAWRRDHLTESYRTLAVKHAGVEAAGKDRDFYLNVATYPSSADFTASQLRNRNWGRVDYAADPSYQWAWDTEANFLLFRELREDAESLRLRRSVVITALVANRLIAGLTALRASRRAGEQNLHVSVEAPPAGMPAPLLRMRYSF